MWMQNLWITYHAWKHQVLKQIDEMYIENVDGIGPWLKLGFDHWISESRWNVLLEIMFDIAN